MPRLVTRILLHWAVRLHQVNSLFLVHRAHGFGKKSENKTKKLVYFSEPEARWLLRKWPRSPCTFRFPHYMRHQFDRCSDAAFGRSASLCSGAVSRRQLKMPLVSVGIPGRPGSRDSFGLVSVLNGAANQTSLERFEDCADISRGRWRNTCWSCAVQKGNSRKKVLMSNSQFASLSLASAKVCVWN